MNKRFRQIRASLAAAVILSTCCVAFAANRCVDDRGKVTYQDAPCASTSSGSAVNTSDAFSTHPKNVAPAERANGSSTAAVSNPPDGAGGYTSYRGAWRGPSQFELSLNGVRDEGAHSVAPMVVEIRPDGEVVKAALSLNAAAVMLAHNHPSGSAEPSRADEHLSAVLKQALSLVDVRVLDHLVVSAVSVTSFAERGLL